MTARILQFGPPGGGDEVDEDRFEASVDANGTICLVIRHREGARTWELTPRQAVELAAFLNNEWAPGRP